MASKNNPAGTAVQGIHKVIDHLAATGTGTQKLDVARASLDTVDAGGSERDGAEHVIQHMQASGLPPLTIAKARRFVEAGMEPAQPVAPAERPAILDVPLVPQSAAVAKVPPTSAPAEKATAK